MDSPTLQTFDYQQFWSQQQYHMPRLAPTTQQEEILQQQEFHPTQEERTEVKIEEAQPVSRKRTTTGKNSTSEEYRSTKNLAKNYGKAITTFALSGLATPYLDTVLEKENLSLQDFLDYIKIAKETIQGIDSFRACLVQQKGDSVKLVAQKRAFQAIGIVFIKYFSVNWIIHGRLNNKIIYLKARFKMIRRLEKPELFTYLQASKPRGKKKKE